MDLSEWDHRVSGSWGWPLNWWCHTYWERLEAVLRRPSSGFSCLSVWAESAGWLVLVFFITVAVLHRHWSRCAPVLGYIHVTVMKLACLFSNDSLESGQFETRTRLTTRCGSFTVNLQPGGGLAKAASDLWPVFLFTCNPFSQSPSASRSVFRVFPGVAAYLLCPIFMLPVSNLFAWIMYEAPEAQLDLLQPSFPIGSGWSHSLLPGLWFKAPTDLHLGNRPGCGWHSAPRPPAG